MGGVAALAVDKAPWWVIAAVAGGGTLLGVVQTVFPQESQDRLKWWNPVGDIRKKDHLAQGKRSFRVLLRDIIVTTTVCRAHPAPDD